MAHQADLPRTIVLRARRDTIVLVAAVVAVTLALSSTIHSRPAPPGLPVQQEQWTGDLADVAPAATPVSYNEPLTSASLVVPTSALALPQVPVRALVKLHGCDGSVCTPKAILPVPVRRPGPSTETTALRRTSPHRTKPSLMARLNPLNHLPDMSKIGRPFAVAGDTVTSWFKRF